MDRTLRLLLFLAAAAAVVYFAGRHLSADPPPRRTGDDPTAIAPAEPGTRGPREAAAAESADGPQRLVRDVTVLSYGKQVFRGDVDLGPTIDRILRGERHSHHNDGAVFGNRERRLPRQERGYYREYVHPTRGIRGAGPQRIVRGEGGDWYYTPDHYDSFVPLTKSPPSGGHESKR